MAGQAEGGSVGEVLGHGEWSRAPPQTEEEVWCAATGLIETRYCSLTADSARGVRPRGFRAVYNVGRLWEATAGTDNAGGVEPVRAHRG
jgi:hypothetical protein